MSAPQHAQDQQDDGATEVARIQRATGLEWATIARAFEDAGDADATHTQLARAIAPLLSGRVDNPDWWAQGATVAYEKTIGRRVAGQSSAGDFQVAVSRTLDGERAARRDAAGERLVAAGTIADLAVRDDARTSETAKRHFWRSGLGEGAKLEAAVEDAPSKSEGTRVRVVLTASGLDAAERRDRARADLKAVLADLS